MKTRTTFVRRVFLGLATFVVASVANASPITYDFTLSGFITYLGNFNDTPPYDPVTGSLTLDGTTLQNFSMNIGPTHYDMSNIVYTTGLSYADIGGSIGGNGGPVQGSNDFSAVIGMPSFLYSNLPYIPSLTPFEYTVAQNNDLYDTSTGSFTVAPIPLPPADILFGTALVGMTGFARRRKKLNG